jgi:MFS family permease
VQKISWRYALVLIIFSILLMLAMMLIPGFAAWLKTAQHSWRDAKYWLVVIVLGVLGGLWLITAALTLIVRARSSAERIRRGQDVSVLKPPESDQQPR